MQMEIQQKVMQLNVYAGNETPVVNIQLNGGNKSFYLPGIPVNYSVRVTDKNDTSKVDPANLICFC